MILPDDSYEPEAFEPYGEDDMPEIEATHDIADRHGYDLATTPLDKLFANQALGFDMAGAMQ